MSGMGLDNDNDSDSLQRTMILMWGGCSCHMTKPPKTSSSERWHGITADSKSKSPIWSYSVTIALYFVGT